MKVELSDIQIKAISIALHQHYYKTVDDDGRAITCKQEIADATYESMKMFEEMEKDIFSKEDENDSLENDMDL